MWDASDVLAFYGAVVAASATIGAVVATILYQRRQNIWGAKPLLQSESNFIPFKENIEKLDIYRCLIYPFNKQEQVGSSKKFSCNYIWDKKYPTFVNQKEYLVFSYTLSNAGLGNAIGIDMKINDLVYTPKFFIGNQELNHILSDCTDSELKAIIEMVKSTKSILRKLSVGNSPK